MLCSKELVQQYLRNAFSGQNKSFDPLQIGFVWGNQRNPGLQRYILELKTNKNQQEKMEQLVVIIFNRYRIRYLL